MQKIKNTADLKSAILLLEHKKTEESALLKGQFLNLCESLKPVNIIKNAFKEVYSAPGLKTRVINAAIGIVSGFVTKKIFFGRTQNLFAKLLGFVTEMVVAGKVAKNGGNITTLGSSILKKLVERHHQKNNE
jgi:hypothetical protein